MNVLEQIKKFVTTALQNNDTVELNMREISDITCESIEQMSKTCQRIKFTVAFQNEGPCGFLKKGKHSYLLDIDTTTLIITDTDLRMKTVPASNNSYHEHITIRILNMFATYNSVYVFTFAIKKKEPAFTIDVNDFTYNKIENKTH